jgi:hypothetical protein
MATGVQGEPLQHDRGRRSCAFIEDDTTAPKTIDAFYKDVKRAIWRSGMYLITALQLGIETERFKAVAHDAQLRTLGYLREIRRLETEKGKMERAGNIDSALTLSALLNPDRGGGGEAADATPPIIPTTDD